MRGEVERLEGTKDGGVTAEDGRHGERRRLWAHEQGWELGLGVMARG